MNFPNMPAVLIDINLFWQIINFLILMLIFNKYLKAPLKKVLEKRQETVSNDLNNAKIAKTEAEALKLEIESLMKKAQKDAMELIYGAEKKAAIRYEDIIKEATSQRDKILKSAELETEKMKESLKKELSDSLRETAATMALELINKKMDKNTQSSLLDEFIDEVGEAKW